MVQGLAFGPPSYISCILTHHLVVVTFAEFLTLGRPRGTLPVASPGKAVFILFLHAVREEPKLIVFSVVWHPRPGEPSPFFVFIHSQPHDSHFLFVVACAGFQCGTRTLPHDPGV